MSVCINCSPRRKLALLITNRKYTKKPLTNGQDNSVELAKRLQQFGFICKVYRDTTITEMQEAFRDFISNLQCHDIIVIYYTGHSKYIHGNLYNSSITPKCRISVANMFQCIRAQIYDGHVLYLGDTCSSDKRHCLYGNCIPRDQRWYDKYKDCDAYNITDHYGKLPQKRMTTKVHFTTILSSEPGTATYAAGTRQLFDHTAALITYMTPLIDKYTHNVSTNPYTFNDVYKKLYDYMIDRDLQRPYMTCVGDIIHITCDKCKSSI
jgi:hypothetical protein